MLTLRRLLSSGTTAETTMKSKLTQALAATRLLSSGTTAEAAMKSKLTQALAATACEVEDRSGGCGAMYAISVTSPQFQGLSTLKQHKLVQSILKDEIADMHGLTLQTHVSS